MSILRHRAEVGASVPRADLLVAALTDDCTLPRGYVV
jgi:hypothetical protein